MSAAPSESAPSDGAVAESPRPTGWRLYQETLRGLFEPRRLVPIVLCSGPLLYAQTRLSDGGPGAFGLGLAMCLTFLGLAPFLWRALVTVEPPARVARALGGLALYAGLSVALVWGVAFGAAQMFEVKRTFLTAPESLWVVVGMFGVGGWGLGRDLEADLRLRRSRARVARMQRELERAQVLAIRGHLDPHFLFNSLNAIAEWCREDGAVAEAAILQLSELLRTLLEGIKHPWWPLSRELELVGGVVAMHRVRDPEAVQLTREVAREAESLPVPPLLLLPLIENAMKHGPAAGHRGEVSLRVARAGDGWDIALSNPGPFAGERPGGEGLALVRTRLDLAYGTAAQLTLVGEARRTTAVVHLPPRALA